MSATELVHFPSSREGFTWCGLRLDIPRSMGISDGAQRSTNGLLFATNMPIVTCPGCDTDELAEPVPPDDSLWFEDRGDPPDAAPWLHIGDRGMWYAFRMTPEKAARWAKVLTDFAEGRPVPARPAGEERSPWMPEFYERKGG